MKRIDYLCETGAKRKKGFTLVELVVVMAVLGILSAVIVPTFSNFLDNSENKIVSIYNNINDSDSEIIVMEDDKIIYQGMMSGWTEKEDYELISVESGDVIIMYVKRK